MHRAAGHHPPASTVSGPATPLVTGDLIERCRRGEREAQREVYQLTSSRVFDLLVRMTGGEDHAFDLTQETYLRAFDRIGQFDGRSSFATWLYRIAVNEALQFLRRGKREAARRGRLVMQEDNRSDSDRAMVRHDVNQALAELEPNDRALLLLRYREELDYRSMAEIIGCAEGTIASRLNRARSKLRSLLSGYQVEASTHRASPAPTTHRILLQEPAALLPSAS